MSQFDIFLRLSNVNNRNGQILPVCVLAFNSLNNIHNSLLLQQHFFVMMETQKTLCKRYIIYQYRMYLAYLCCRRKECLGFHPSTPASRPTLCPLTEADLYKSIDWGWSVFLCKVLLPKETVKSPCSLVLEVRSDW